MVRKIRKIIEKNEKFLVLSHIEPDGDSVGSVIALAEGINFIKGKRCTAYYPVDIPQRLRFLVKRRNIARKIKNLDHDVAFILDCSNISRIAGLSLSELKHMTIVNIDHHISNLYFGDINWVEPEMSSVGEMIFEIFSNMQLPRLALEGIYTALITDTGKFTYKNVTERTLKTAAKLVRLGVEPYKIASYLYHNFPHNFLNILGLALLNAKRLLDGKVLFITVDPAKTNLTYEMESIVELSMLEQGIMVSALFYPLNGRTKVSIRSKDRINVDELASSFGGGGHRNAAGFVVNLPIQKAQKLILAEIEKRGF